MLVTTFRRGFVQSLRRGVVTLGLVFGDHPTCWTGLGVSGLSPNPFQLHRLALAAADALTLLGVVLARALTVRGVVSWLRGNARTVLKGPGGRGLVTPLLSGA